MRLPLLSVLAFGAASMLLAEGSPLRPQEEMKTFRFADRRLEAELAASEPQIIAPVAIAWDAHARLFVVEMTDYPSGSGGGRVRLLEDSDGDGHYERAHLFAERLPYPTGVMAWRDGILVTAAPNIWFLADTDGDQRADVRKILLTGFTEGNQQLRVNGLFFGLDNWIYGANGRSDGEIRWADAPGSEAVSIRRNDFRFRPETGQFEAVAGHSQYGMAVDDWGNRFPVFNNLPVRHVVIEERYTARAGMRQAPDLTPSITAGGTALFPLTEANLLVPQPPGFTTSACGPHAWRSDKLPPEYYHDIFVGEPVQNLVHRRKLFPSGATFSAERVETQQEFLASTDPWFHPVYMATGPDGYLYVVDFYREFVEHPHWVAKELQGAVNWRSGEAHGRIWRVKQKSDPGDYQVPRLHGRNGPQLARALESGNSWERDTAHRLIFERQDPSAAGALAQVAERSPRASARVQALHALSGINALGPDTLLIALRDQHPRVRETALKLCEPFLWSNRSDTKLLEAALGLEYDSDPRVQLQLALTLSGVANPSKFPVLATLAANARGDNWRELAAQIGARQDPLELLRRLPDEPRFLPLVRAAASQAPADGGLAAFSAWARGVSLSTRVAALGAFAERQRAGGSEPPEEFKMFEPPSLLSIAPEARADALLLLAWLSPDKARSVLPDLLMPNEPEEVRQTAIRLAREMADENTARRIVRGWERQPHSVRKGIMAAAPSSGPLALALLASIEMGAISASEIDASTSGNLLRSKNPSVKQLAEKLLFRAPSDRQAVFESFKPALKLPGSPREGAQIFARLCASCHTMQGVGQSVGPELAGVSLRAPENLLNDILDPSGQVLPDFASYTVTTRDGEAVTGFIAAESPDSVTIRRPNAPDQTIRRSQIGQLRAEGKSLMPDGLEAGLSHQDMASLISFIQRPTRELLQNALLSLSSE